MDGAAEMYRREIILVLGNGFDIAHGLPTGYPDFLKFEKAIKAFLKYEKSSGNDNEGLENALGIIDDKIANMIRKKMGNDNKGNKLKGNLFSQKELWNKLLNENVWIDCFEQAELLNDGWIDLEAEMGRVIQEIDGIIKNADVKKVSLVGEPKIKWLSLYLEKRDLKITAQNIVKLLKEDLEKLTRALELYFSEYVDDIMPDKQCLDIIDLKPTKVLNFNYTDTYKKIYDKGDSGIVYDYIHGHAEATREMSDCNMVLGIDEYLPENEKDTELLFVEFKKYYQRLYYKNQRLADGWCEDIKKDAEYEAGARKYLFETEVEMDLINDKPILENADFCAHNYEKILRIKEELFIKAHPKHQIVIFGHSLGVTDKDILRKLILNPNVHVTIYYHSPVAYAEQLKNLVRVIGQDELNKRTGGKYKAIEFKMIRETSKLVDEIECGDK